MSKSTPSAGFGSLGSGAVTAVALAVQTGLAGVVGIVLGREFGRGPETDGFFAAYGVFVVVVLAANAIRVTVLPSFARAREGGRLGSEVAAYTLSLAALAVPLIVLTTVWSHSVADVLTGDRGDLARDTAAGALSWMMLAAVCQLFAGLAASALAALDDYATAAAGFVLGSLAGLGYILLRVHAEGVQALSHGMALNGAVALAVPAFALVLRSRVASMPACAVRPGGASTRSRFATMGMGVALPLALQAFYVVSVPLASREGDGALTSFGYAYLIASAVVAVTASSLGLVTAVPLARIGLDTARTARHVVASAWIALVVIGAATGVFALAGGSIAEAFLGGSYGAATGDQLGRLVVLFAPWAVVSVGVSVTFPLVFVARKGRTLPLVAVGAVAVHVLVALAAWWSGGLDGLALALALTTGGVLAVLLHELGALHRTVEGLARATVIVAVGAFACFTPSRLLLPPVPAAAVGLAAYALFVAIARPSDLRYAWRYLRSLG